MDQTNLDVLRSAIVYMEENIAGPCKNLYICNIPKDIHKYRYRISFSEFILSNYPLALRLWDKGKFKSSGFNVIEEQEKWMMHKIWWKDENIAILCSDRLIFMKKLLKKYTDGKN